MPNKVFISYRREDSRYQARRIYDAFVQALPPDTVFMDVDSIPPGADFVDILEGWVQQCDVLLALIGPRWIGSVDPRTNLRRLDNPEDFARIEIRGALERKIPVVPVLLDAAEMPTAAELPDDIKALRRRHAEFVDFRTFDADVQRLIKGLTIRKRTERPGEALADDRGGRHAGVAPVATFLERVKPDAVAAKPMLLVAAAVLLLAAGAAAFVMSATPHDDASAGLADFAKSEESRRTAEARANLATDALAQAEKARQEAEAKAAAAAAAQAKSEESRQAAETRAGEAEKARLQVEAKAAAAVAALAKAEENRGTAEARANEVAEAAKKSEKARVDAEARAASAAAAQAKAEEGQRTADKARLAAAAAASDAAVARAQADNSRQFAEVRANDATEALKKSEKARQEAEAKLAELRKAVDARPSPAPSLRPAISSSSPRKLLTDIGSTSRWAMYGTTNCNNTKDAVFRSLEVGNGSITWVNGLGRAENETITASYENAFYTNTSSYSRHNDSLFVQPGSSGGFFLERCP